MPLTGGQLLVGLSKFVADYFASTATSSGGTDGSTLVDTSLGRFGTDELRGMYLRPTSGNSENVIRRIIEFSPATGTCEVRPAFPTQILSGTTYELHRYDPARKYESLDEARYRVYPFLAKHVYYDEVTGDGRTSEFTIPSSIRKGPAFVFQENPLTVGDQWNFLSQNEGSSLDGWTAVGFVPSLYQRTDRDLLIPKYNEQCTRLDLPASTAGSYTQAVDAMRDIEAADAAGRKMSLGVWVYCTTAGRVYVQIEDDDGTVDSAFHNGNGWQLLTVEKVIDPANTTTLSASIQGDSGSALSIFWNRAWFYYGTKERVTDIYDHPVQFRVLRDGTNQSIELPFTPLRGYQLQFVGRDVISPLNGSSSATTEIDEAGAELLYAYAAQTLFEKEALTAATPIEVGDRINLIVSRKADYQTKWPFSLPATPRVKGWWVN